MTAPAPASGENAPASQQAPATRSTDPDLLLLPDVQPVPAADFRIEVDRYTGRRYLWFTAIIPNVGPGPLELWGHLDAGSGKHRATQRIYRRDGSHVEVEVGAFRWHEEHDHWPFDRGFMMYELRSVSRGDELGHKVTTSDKTTWCLTDSDLVRPDMPSASPQAVYTACEPEGQRISTGWADVYDNTTEGQSVDITDVLDGLYALHSIANPDRTILEASYLNNVAVAHVEIRGTHVAPVPPP